MAGLFMGRSFTQATRELSGVPPSERHNTVAILGVRLANLDSGAAYREIERLAARGTTAVVYYANANTLSFVLEDPRYGDVLNRADLLCGDGIGVRLAALMRGVALKANLSGTDMVPELLKAWASRGRRCFILGGEEAANRNAAEFVAAKFAGWTVAGRNHGFF
jgi:N-acetylglucosaminyldiphosphoundecaprenol N-acetyl-beta-D-mannosaminyltransferase